MRWSSPVRKALCVATLAACGLLLQACSAVKLTYNKVQHLAYWQLNSYLDLSEAQTERVRDELGDLHRWHRDTMLPRHAELLQTVQLQLPSAISPDQACHTYDAVRTQIDKVVAQAEPKLVWLAAQLTDAQTRNLQKKQASSNADWKKEWVDVTPDQLRELRFKQLLSRAETFYGALDEVQKAALRDFIARSSFDPQRTYAERLRRQKDLVQVLHKIAEDRANTEQARTLLRGYIARFNTSPDAAYQRYAQMLVQEGCEGFSRVHNAMTTAQRLKAVQSVKGYQQDFLVLAAQ
ncbi:hypothetical protein CBP36_05405 [Acidovorax carolinensis]|uniref:Lipoprotein n=1 Tax=Acidovorax carolinensis TaxID=553814 RepID=A0A240UBB8_9BURK|nr:DUF6279 family lipoprotein [Acidovorax carolinensis]ART55755.1 hypothetical protein CBP35_13530 [Acidovorax carolinensis]ART58375.1 hypothetical protein CBP36_05405 [Acidovorax carolinensis]